MMNEVVNSAEEKILNKLSKVCLNIADNLGTAEQFCPLFFYEPKKPEEFVSKQL